MYTVENIPYSRRSPAEARVASFPFAALQVGQSFFVPDDAEAERATPIPAKAAEKLLGINLIVRTEVNDEGVSGRRVYRVADASGAGAEGEATE